MLFIQSSFLVSINVLLLFLIFILMEEKLTLTINHILNHLVNLINIVSYYVLMFNQEIMHYLHFFQIFIHFYQQVMV